MRSRFGISVFAAVFAASAAPAATYSVIYLDDGQIYGKIVAENRSEYRVKIECSDVTTAVPKQKVVRVEPSTRCRPPSPPKGGAPR